MFNSYTRESVRHISIYKQLINFRHCVVYVNETSRLSLNRSNICHSNGLLVCNREGNPWRRGELSGIFMGFRQYSALQYTKQSRECHSGNQ